jgi:ankyrin repeat protein
MKHSVGNLSLSLLLLVLPCIFGCGHQKTAFEKASGAIYNGDSNLLQQIVITNKSVLAQVSGFDGSTLLHEAVVNTPRLECAWILISSGIDVNKADITGKSPLQLLCECSASPDAIQLLLTNGVTVNYKDKAGRTALDYAKANGQGKEAVSLLMEHGAKD